MLSLIFMGMIDFSSVQSYSGVHIPVPFKYGLAFSWSSFIAVGLIYMITAIEAYGDITANSMISGEPVEGEKFIKRASGGILADGFNSFLAGAFNSFPNSVFAQNNGMIQLTGVCQSLRGILYCCFFSDTGTFSCCWAGILVNAGTGSGGSDTTYVRYGCCCRNPYYCLPEYK